ncbi:hypothetical protein AU210_016719 [Fusarium oxysporum f. sp. radicis-cucumerinum]|uniref:Uncharacterized protein n=1 Tax=Fusarium oxysporum f. sp. radicis-cucumerinum TaxID=327505 RepID=A0A2H3FZC9_FUSOX|nr:hypothetical protein AU210_016719 [Fusarium oxysporum f. sp. radicis-cucumerinum]
MREGKSLRAIDFAADTGENSEERYDRSGGKDQVYKEVTHKRNQDRMAIVRELSDEAGEVESRNTEAFSHLNGFALTTLRDGRSIISLLANFDVPNRHKTIGILFRGDTIGGPGFPPVAAMSGWKHQSDPELNVQIEEEHGQMRSFASVESLATTYLPMKKIKADPGSLRHATQRSN